MQNADFRRPDQVLGGLNAMFPMADHGDMYFTIWYGVYNRLSRKLTYASGGHPPALLIQDVHGKGPEIRELITPNVFIGALSGIEFEYQEIQIEPEASLLIFSDGVYEIMNEDGSWWDLDGLKAYLADSFDTGNSIMDDLWAHVRQIGDSETLEDDFSFLELSIS